MCKCPKRILYTIFECATPASHFISGRRPSQPPPATTLDSPNPTLCNLEGGHAVRFAKAIGKKVSVAYSMWARVYQNYCVAT